jgi:hypothetical protein
MRHDVPGSSPYSTRSIEVVSKVEYDRIRDALEKIADRGPDVTSVDQWSYFPVWAKEIAEKALSRV